MTRTLRSRRFTLAAAALVCFSVAGGLAACGDRSATSTSVAPLTTSPTVPPKVIVVQSGSGSAPLASVGVDEAPGDSKMRPMSVTYVYAGAFADLPATSASWYFPTGVSPSEKQLQRLADVLGVSGAVTKTPDDPFGGWIVGAQDYSTPTVSGGADALQSWWYGAGSEGVFVSEPCAFYPPGDPAGNAATADSPICSEPAPPANVPDESEARDKADAMMAQLGFDPADFEQEVYADEFGASVTGYLRLDGVRTPISVGFGFGENGKLTWASGYLGTPVRGDDYPLIDVDAAVQRLNDQSGMWMRYGVDPSGMDDYAPVAGATAAAGQMIPEAGVAVEPPPSTAIAGDDVVTVSPLPPVGPPDYCDPAACERVPLDQVVVTLSNARPSLEQVWAEDGTVWLLPGYAFDADDQGTYSVAAVEDRYMQQQDTVPVETVPVETVPVETVPVETVPVETACDSSLVINQFDPVPLDVADVQFLVGLCIDDAIATGNGLGVEVRVARHDGIDLPVTADLRPNRANVVVDNGIVAEILSIG